MIDEISKKVEEKQELILEFVKSLIRIPTQNPPGENYDKIVEKIKEELKKEDVEFKIYSKNNKPNLVVRWNVDSSKTLHINGHYDVVPVTPNWKHKPFSPVIEGKKLFGRGASDMKSDLAVMVYSIKVLQELKLKPACNIELSFTCDEESGGIDGLGYLVNQKLIRPDYALVMDGMNDTINNAHKGVLALEITVIGKSSHAAWPQKGINAFIGACKLSEKLNDLNRKLSKTKSTCKTKEKIEKSPTLVLGGVAKGGNKFNTVPGEFSFTVDRRIIPEENIQDARKQIDEIIDKFKKTSPEYVINIKTLLEAEPAFTDENSKISRVLFNNIKNIKGRKPNFSLLPGFLDMRFFVNDAKIPCVSYSVSGEHAHGDDEYVNIPTIFENIRILASVILDKELA